MAVDAWIARAATRDLGRKGVPPVESLRGKPVVHAIFVPRVAAKLRRSKLPFVVIDAATILGDRR